MRFMLRFRFPTTAESNTWVREGVIRQKLDAVFEAIQPEAAYFGPVDGSRGGYIVINMEEASEIPPILEPFFQELGAKVELFPVMTREDLGMGLQRRYGST